MKLRLHTVREYANAMLALLPPGAAWRWPVDGLGDKIFQAMALELLRIELILQQVLDRAIELHRPNSSRYTLADYQAVADAAVAAYSETLPRQSSRAGLARAGQRLWSPAANNSSWLITKVKLVHLQGPTLASKATAGQRLMGARARYVIRVFYYAGVVDRHALAAALQAFKQAHVVLFFEDISGHAGNFYYA